MANFEQILERVPLGEWVARVLEVDAGILQEAASLIRQATSSDQRIRAAQLVDRVGSDLFILAALNTPLSEHYTETLEESLVPMAEVLTNPQQTEEFPSFADTLTQEASELMRYAAQERSAPGIGFLNSSTLGGVPNGM